VDHEYQNSEEKLASSTDLVQNGQSSKSGPLAALVDRGACCGQYGFPVSRPVFAVSHGPPMLLQGIGVATRWEGASGFGGSNVSGFAVPHSNL
jgi:hypothetical protein